MDGTSGGFDTWADLYDADYEEQDIGDVEFYADLAADADGPVLEVGCGTGRVYLELLERGVDAHGIDLSRPMLDELERKAADRGLDPSVRVADMREFEAEREYDLVIVPFRSFLHNTTRADQQSALRQFRAALADDGRLVLNFFATSSDVVCETYGERMERTVVRDGEELTLDELTEYVDEVAQRVRVERTAYDQSGDEVASMEAEIKLVSRDEFVGLLETTGWSDWTVYGGFDYDPLESVTQEMVWVAEP